MYKNLTQISFLAVILFATVLSVFGQQGGRHPIDAAQEKCLQSHKGTMPRAECYSKAFEAWEKDVADTYAKLELRLPTNQAAALKTAQSDWEKYRDSEFEFISSLYAKKRGTGYITVRITLRIEIVKSRALLLEKRLQSLIGAGG